MGLRSKHESMSFVAYFMLSTVDRDSLGKFNV